MPPKGKGKQAAKGAPKKEAKGDDPDIADAKNFFKRYAASSAANGLEPLPLPHPEGALTKIAVRRDRASTLHRRR